MWEVLVGGTIGIAGVLGGTALTDYLRNKNSGRQRRADHVLHMKRLISSCIDRANQLVADIHFDETTGGKTRMTLWEEEVYVRKYEASEVHDERWQEVRADLLLLQVAEIRDEDIGKETADRLRTHMQELVRVGGALVKADYASASVEAAEWIFSTEAEKLGEARKSVRDESNAIVEMLATTRPIQ